MHPSLSVNYYRLGLSLEIGAGSGDWLEKGGGKGGYSQKEDDKNDKTSKLIMPLMIINSSFLITLQNA